MKKGQLVECCAIEIHMKFNFKKKANMLGINYTVPCLTLVFLFPVPRSLPLQNRRPFGTCYLSVLVSNRLKSLEKKDIHKFCQSIFSFCIKMSSQSGEKMSLNKSFLIVTVPKTFQRHRPH